MKRSFRQNLLASTLLVGASVLTTPAWAQDTPTRRSGRIQANRSGRSAAHAAVSAQGEDVQTGRDIVVTGTRIPQPNLESAAPVTVVTDQDFKLSGTTRVEDVLNQLPSVGAVAGLGRFERRDRHRRSRPSLPRLEAHAVSVNGRRLIPGDPNSTTQAADLNFIPSSLIKRAEVLTGGASSVYGADAVAGVVNFIMDTEFTGIRFDGQYSFYQHNNDDPSVSAAA